MSTMLARLIVSVADLDRALEFYQGVLCLPATRGPGVAFLDSGFGIAVMLHEREAVPSDRSVVGAFRVAGVDEHVAAWVALGGLVVDQPANRTWGERMAVVRDADGHLVCLLEGQADVPSPMMSTPCSHGSESAKQGPARPPLSSRQTR